MRLAVNFGLLEDALDVIDEVNEVSKKQGQVVISLACLQAEMSIRTILTLLRKFRVENKEE